MENENRLRKKAYNQLQVFLSDCNVTEPKGKKVFEVGFRNGLFIDESEKTGLVTTGIEIRKEFYEKTKADFPNQDLILYDGGTFPVPDNSFDFVVSFQVLEHVKSIEHIFKECIRILKPGGIMYHVCPNYHSFYEGHYKIIWFPFLNKTLGRYYLKQIGRHTSTFEDLINIVKPNHIAKILKRNENNIEILSLGKKEFVNRFNENQIDKVDQSAIRKILKLVLKSPILKKTFLGLINACNFYYPITVIVKKNTHKLFKTHLP
jgi:SAM-dependent methyltransferase